MLIASVVSPWLLTTAMGIATDKQHTPVVDAHLHCFAGKASREFPYHPRGPYQPEAASPPELLLERMKLAEVDYAIVVQPEPFNAPASRLKKSCRGVKSNFCYEVGQA